MKKMKIIILLFSAVFATKSCSSESISIPEEIEVQPSTQTLYFNGKIFTVDEANPWAEAILIDGNKILFIGSNSNAENTADNNATKIDLQGKLVLPGFHDVHMHPMEVGSTTTVFSSAFIFTT